MAAPTDRIPEEAQHPDCGYEEILQGNEQRCAPIERRCQITPGHCGGEGNAESVDGCGEQTRSRAEMVVQGIQGCPQRAVREDGTEVPAGAAVPIGASPTQLVVE